MVGTPPLFSYSSRCLVSWYRSLLLKPDKTTIEIYNSKIEEYLQMVKSELELEIEANFAKSLPRGGTVLDYGCGPGHSAKYFADQGLISHAFDASTEMVRVASKNPNVKVWQSTFHKFTSTNTYNGIWASFSLLHAARSDMQFLLEKIHSALKSDGKFYIAIKLGNGELRDTLGRIYTYYQEEELRQVLKNAGFIWQSHHVGRSTGLDGKTAQWIAVLAHV